MTVKPPPTASQPPLFDLLPDKPLTTPGESRTRYGRVVEEIMCDLLGLTDIPNSGSHDVVFDAWREGWFIEIKSVRHGAKIPIYEWRRKKDRRAGVPLIYVVAVHRCTKAETLSEVWHKMTDTIREVLVVPAAVMARLAKSEPLNRLVKHDPQSRMGYKRKGYCEGYRNIPLSRIRETVNTLPVHRRCEIHGLDVSANVRFHQHAPWFA